MTATYTDRLPTAPAGGPRGWVQRHPVAASATTPPLQPSAPEAASGDERIRSKEGEETAMATLQIELEDMAGTSWWTGVLATLGSQSGNAYMRFVGRVDGHRRYKSATFPAPRTLGRLPPEEAWAPGMTESLQDLRREIENDGWVEAGRDTEPWAFKYERFASG